MNRLQIKNNPKILQTIIKEFLSSDEYHKMETSEEYYESENIEIEKREKKMMLFNENEEPFLADDFSKANHKLQHNFHYELINQTKNYLCGKPVRLSWKDEASPNDMLKTTVNDIIYKYNDWGIFNQENVKNAQKYGIAWSRVVIDKNGKLRLINVDSREVIPFYDDYKSLECVIRIFEKTEYKEDGTKEKVKYAEVYDDTFKDVYRKKTGDYELLAPDVPLLQRQMEYGQLVMNGQALNWGAIPWVMWKFNEDEMDSLTPIKSFVDMLDINLSDLANNIDDIQDAIWILENYQGQSIEQFMQDLKIKKAINVGEGGSVQSKTIDIPYEARMKLYEACEKNIYRFGRGIDFANRQQLGNSTGVALKWSYGPLDEKADELEQNGQSALNQLFNLILTYLKHIGMNSLGLDSNSIEFIFDRTMITNEKEIIESVIRSATLLSTKTLLENHPMVDDASEELIRLADPQFGNIEEVNNAIDTTTETTESSTSASQPN